jgi:hypothetical protein
MPDGHECPATRCALHVAPGKLMCRTHWYMVPAPIRTAVWDAWAGGMNAGSPSHRAACADAIEAVNAKLGARNEPTAEEIARCGESEDPYHRCRACHDYVTGQDRVTRRG